MFLSDSERVCNTCLLLAWSRRYNQPGQNVFWTFLRRSRTCQQVPNCHLGVVLVFLYSRAVPKRIGGQDGKVPKREIGTRFKISTLSFALFYVAILNILKPYGLGGTKKKHPVWYVFDQLRRDTTTAREWQAGSRRCPWLIDISFL